MGLLDLKQIKCKTCGEPLDLNNAHNGVIKCGICDSCFTLPKFDASQKVLDYLFQAEGDLDTGRFEEAYTKFAKAAELDKTEPEAYFGMALAEYKVQYLKDEVNNRLQPICHEINDKDFGDSPNFLKAIRYATDEQRKEYERKGNEINYIKNEFYKIANSGVKYDCFICVKVSDENGGRTADYKTADDIYFELKGKEYKPFFSERELGGVTGADYEARILYALYSCECMLVVCFDEAYLRTKWVKNEYTRFLKLVNEEEKESDSIALVFGNRPIEKLPNRHGKIQGIAINSLTAMERIVSFVDNHTPEAKRRREEAVSKREEEARRKAEQDEVQRKKLAEQEEKIRELEERLKNQPQQTLSDEELFERFERARKERERKEAERKAAEEKVSKEEERERQEREAKEAEERARKAEEERAKREAEERERQKRELRERNARDFEIENGVLKKYKGTDTKVVIPGGVTEIGEEAFYDCNLTSVIIPDGVISIGKSAFGRCSILESVTIPDGVKSIGSYAFGACDSLKSITIPNSVKSIGAAFQNCGRLTSITIPDGVTSIEDYAFHFCHSLKSITIPNSVTSIGVAAFDLCTNLTSITIPSSVKSIGVCAFNDCRALERITVDSGNSEYKSENNCLLSKDGKELIFGCKNSKIPNSVNIIDIGAFEGCWELKSITIPSSVTSIGHSAFKDCIGLTSILIPNSVTDIGREAFKGCSKLTHITVPDSVTSIGEGAFGKNTDRVSVLESITLPFVGESKDGKGKKHFGYIFGASSFASNQYYVPASLKSVIITGGMYIGVDAFRNCSELTSITLPNGLTSIGHNAFEGCSGLTGINIPNGVTNIRNKAFNGCSGLTGIQYDGTKKQWETIVKDDEWDKGTGDYTVYFSHGLIKKMKKEK